MRIVFDEYAQAQEFIINGLDKIDFWDLIWLVKYYRYWEYKEDDIYKELIRICELSFPGFNSIKYSSYIRKVIISARKYKFKDLVKVTIAKKEVDVLKRFSYRYSKILYTMLVFAKFNKCNFSRVKITEAPTGYVCGYDIVDVLKFAEIRMTKKEIHEFTNFMDQKNGIISASNKGKYWILSKDFVEDSTEFDPAFVIQDYSDIYRYLPTWCQQCGSEIKNGIRNNKKYCPNCWRERVNASKRRWWHDNMAG